MTYTGIKFGKALNVGEVAIFVAFDRVLTLDKDTFFVESDDRCNELVLWSNCLCSLLLSFLMPKYSFFVQNASFPALALVTILDAICFAHRKDDREEGLPVRFLIDDIFSNLTFKDSTTCNAFFLFFLQLHCIYQSVGLDHYNRQETLHLQLSAKHSCIQNCDLILLLSFLPSLITTKY